MQGTSGHNDPSPLGLQGVGTSRSPLPDLRLLESACRNQSFTKAARECRVSRPAVSAQVQKVEKLIGAPLFTRDGGRMRPTPAAWDLALAYAQARMIMQRAINQVLV